MRPAARRAKASLWSLRVAAHRTNFEPGSRAPRSVPKYRCSQLPRQPKALFFAIPAGNEEEAAANHNQPDLPVITFSASGAAQTGERPPRNSTKEETAKPIFQTCCIRYGSIRTLGLMLLSPKSMKGCKEPLMLLFFSTAVHPAKCQTDDL
jgi:hypothetical protein